MAGIPFRMRRIFFILLLVSLVLCLLTFNHFLHPFENKTIFFHHDQDTYLGLVNHAEFPFQQNPYSGSPGKYLFIWEFQLIHFFDYFLKNIELSSLIFTAIVVALIGLVVFLFGVRLKINAYLFSSLFFLVNPGLYILTAFGIRDGWTSDWEKGTILTFNLWHPLFVVEVLVFLIFIYFYFFKKNNEKISAVLSFVLFFGRPYTSLFFFPFFFVADYIKHKRVNPYSIISGFVFFIYILFVQFFSNSQGHLAVYSNYNFYLNPLGFFLGSIVLIVLGFFGIRKSGFNKKLGGLAIFFLFSLVVLFPVNASFIQIATLFFSFFSAYILTIFLSSKIGLRKIGSILLCLLFLITIFGAILYNEERPFALAPTYSDSEIELMKSLQDQSGSILAPERISRRLVRETLLIPVFANYSFDYNEMTHRRKLVEEFYSGITQIVIEDYDPDFIWLPAESNAKLVEGYDLYSSMPGIVIWRKIN